jgi:hypothetical protein
VPRRYFSPCVADYFTPLQEMIAAKPSQRLDDKWGKGALTPDVFVQMVYEGMTARKG